MQQQADSVAPLDLRQILIDVFIRLHFNELALGVRELLDALRIVEAGWCDDNLESLQQAARLLWCKSSEDERVLETEWNRVIMASWSKDPEKREKSAGISEKRSESKAPDSDQSESPPMLGPLDVQAMTSTWGALPILAPFVPTHQDTSPELCTYWPVSRRFMAYTWRYLRRPIFDGPADVLDIKTTIDRAAYQGFYLGPVYRRRERNHAHLVLLIDQGGSMVPFHRFTRDVVETARFESTIAQVNALYFHNVPANSVYLNPHLTSPYLLSDLLEQCSEDGSVLIISDAGAARGHYHRERIQATSRFLSQLRQKTNLVSWLNPMPQDRWAGSSAQIIAQLLPMFQMDQDGFSNAIDVARGQPLSHER